MFQIRFSYCRQKSSIARRFDAHYLASDSKASIVDALNHFLTLPDFKDMPNLAAFQASIKGVLESLNAKEIMAKAIDAIKDAVLTQLQTAIPTFIAANLNPGVGAISKVITIGRFLLDHENVDQIGEFVEEMGSAVPHLKDKAGLPAAAAVERGLKKATPLVISLVASMVKLNGLPELAGAKLRKLGGRDTGSLGDGVRQSD